MIESSLPLVDWLFFFRLEAMGMDPMLPYLFLEKHQTHPHDSLLFLERNGNTME